MKKANRPKRRLRAFKQYVRASIRNYERSLVKENARPYLVNRIGYHIVKWNGQTYDAYLLLYDKKIYTHDIESTSPYARDRFQHIPDGCARPVADWIMTSTDHYKSDVWDNLNKIIQEIDAVEHSK